MNEINLEYFEQAKKLNKEHEDILRERNGHFRGNLKSLSLISLKKNTPECGKSGLNSKKVDVILINKKLDDIEKKGLGRRTREKELQAWIISYAQNNSVLPFGNSIRFLTSEFAYGEKDYMNGEKVVTDILGIDEENNLVVIELKTGRDKTELEKQIKEFCGLIEQKKDLFKELVKLLLEVKWSEGIKKIIVWPYEKEPRTDWKDKEIIEIRYKEVIDNGKQNYKFI
ncbi:MAG: hypothetical protein KAI43_03330 [Candidatus Aureabacteria bacterium]|nr:hypothetical protein [Candidatus Auribacterota bacterium]